MKTLNLIAAILAPVPVMAEKVYTIPVRSRSVQTRQASGFNVPMIDWFNRTDNQWYSTIAVGTPPQNLTVIWDTGSIDLLLPGVNCTTCIETGHAVFDPVKSTTFSPLPGNATLTNYGSGVDTIPIDVPEPEGGVIVHDKIALGNLVVDNQGFTLVNVSAAALNKMPADGIMGIGPVNYTSIGEQPWYWQLYYSGQLESPLYSFYIPAGDIDGAEITLGGVDDTKYEGDISYTQGHPAQWYIFDQTGLYANGNLVSAATAHAILDTGTAFLQTPDYATAVALYAAISPNITQIDPAGAWGAPCDELDSIAPELTFTLGSPPLNVTVPREAFNVGEYPGLPGICQAVFNNPVPALTLGSDVWLLGAALLKQYYTVWDGINYQVGWGKLVSPS